jgi:hypothetical protein
MECVQQHRDVEGSFLQQVADALAAARSRLDVLREDLHPNPGCSSRIRRAATRPSSVCVGGIRMSTIAASGQASATCRRSAFARTEELTSKERRVAELVAEDCSRKALRSSGPAHPRPRRRATRRTFFGPSSWTGAGRGAAAGGLCAGSDRGRASRSRRVVVVDDVEQLPASRRQASRPPGSSGPRSSSRARSPRGCTARSSRRSGRPSVSAPSPGRRGRAGAASR